MKLTIIAHKALIIAALFIAQTMHGMVVTELTSVPLDAQSNTIYLAQNNLELDGTGPAITIDGKTEVTIDLQGFNLIIPPDQIGFFIQNSFQITIKNGNILSSSPSTNTNSNGVFLNTINGVTIQNISFVDMLRGVASLNQVADNTNLVIENCTFSQVSPAATRGISLAAIKGLRVENCSFQPTNQTLTNQPIHILLENNYANATIKSCTFDGAGFSSITAQSLLTEGGNIFVFQSSNLLIEDCQFTNSGYESISILGGLNTIIRTSSAIQGPNQFAAILFAKAVTPTGQPLSPEPQGLLVEQCTLNSLSNGDPIFGINAGIILGYFAPNNSARDITVQRTTITHRTNPKYWDILVPQAHGLIIDKVILDNTALARDANGCPLLFNDIPIKAANIHLGFPFAFGTPTGTLVSDVLIQDSIMSGPSQDAIVSDPANDTSPNERITIKNVSLTAQEEGVDFVHTTSSTITESRIKNIPGNQFALGIGIHLEGPVSYNNTATASHNEITGNTISSNENGIIIETGAVDNVVINNLLYNNTDCDICGDKTKNSIMGNTVITGNKNCLCRRPRPPLVCPVPAATISGENNADIMNEILGAIASRY